jgi:hypothetical protein
MKNRALRGLSILLMAVLLEGCSLFQRGGLINPRRVTYLIPDGYVGWVEVQYGVPHVPRFPMEGGSQVIRVPARGVVQTSDRMEYTWEKVEYFYVAGARRRPLRETAEGEGGMVWGGHTAGPVQSNAPGFVPAPWTVAEGFFVGTEAQWKESSFLATEPSKLEKEFYAFGRLCGREDGAQGWDAFAENPNAPRTAMVGAGKTQVYLAERAGGIPGTTTSKAAREPNSEMAEAYRLHSVLIAASSYGQYKDVEAFKTGYGTAQVIIRIHRHSTAGSR